VALIRNRHRSGSRRLLDDAPVGGWLAAGRQEYEQGEQHRTAESYPDFFSNSIACSADAANSAVLLLAS
jgi:hypothetical protein